MPITLTVEDGTGLAGANSYASLAEARTYHEARQNVAWTAQADVPGDNLKAALIRGSSYVDGRYAGKFPGSRKEGRDQAMAWPRADAFDQDGWEIDEDAVPPEVKKAAMEAALRELASPGSLMPDVTMTDRIKRERVDVLEVEYAASSSAADSIPVVGAIDDILAPILGKVSSTTVSSFARA